MYHLPDEALVSVAPPTNLPVQSPRSEESRVQNIRSVGGHDEHDLTQPVNPIHLVQQLHESSLNLSVSRGALREPPASNGVYLIHEDDTWLVVSGIGWEGQKRSYHYYTTSSFAEKIFLLNCEQFFCG